MMTNSSAVVETLQRSSANSWRTWRELVEAGKGSTDEAVTAFEESQLAGRAWLDEVAGREVLDIDARRSAAVDDGGPEADLGLAAAVAQARAA